VTAGPAAARFVDRLLAAGFDFFTGVPCSLVRTVLAELERRLGQDLERGTTGAGPHLHDVRIEADGRELRGYGSQGEQRIAVLALVLAEAQALAERTGATPLVLLDDVLSELDEQRRLALGELLGARGQTVVTTTSPASLPVAPAQSLAVRPGEVSAE
jgi:DNA replication and repair protein RecF